MSEPQDPVVASNELLGGEMICPECGRECGRDEVHNGVCMLYGPWGCSCGWSEDERYRHNPDTRYDSRGGFTPNPRGQPPPNGGRLDGVVGRLNL